MSNNLVILFVSFWGSLFFLSLGVMNSLIDVSRTDIIDDFLIVLLCIFTSYELAKRLALKLTKDES